MGRVCSWRPPLRRRARGRGFPAESVGRAVRLYHRFPLFSHEVEELLFERGITVSYESARAWCARFGPAYATDLRCRQPRPGDKRHTDEVFIKVKGRMRYLWRVVVQDGTVLDILVQDRRDAAVAKQFLRRLLKDCEYAPRVVATDRLRSCGAAHRAVMPSVEHRTAGYLNNRAESSHQPARQRERAHGVLPPRMARPRDSSPRIRGIPPTSGLAVSQSVTAGPR